MNLKDIKPVFQASLNNDAFDDENLTISFIALSKNNIHKRSLFDEEYFLSVDTKGVKFNATTFYKDHDVSFENAIGKIQNVKFENGDIKVIVKFNAEIDVSKQAFLKYKNGLSKSVSVGFGDIKIKEKEQINGLKHFEIYDGVVEELSAVWQGADKNAVIAKFNKGVSMQEQNTQNTQNLKVDEVKELKNKISLEKQERDDIIELAKAFNVSDLGLEAIAKGLSYKEFSKSLAKLNASKDYEKINITTSEKKEENNTFSVARILANAINPNSVKLGCEVDYIGKNGGFFLPNDFIAKFNDELTTTKTASGAVNEIYRGDLLIEQLKQESEFLNKVHFLSDLTGKITIPRDNSLISADFVEEGKSKDAGSLNFDYISLSPHTLTSSVIITRTMLNMGFFSLDAYAYTLIKEAIRKKLEEVLLYGDGVVKGLFNVAGIPAIANYLTAPTLEKTLEFGDKLDEANIDTNKAVFFFKGSDLSTLKATPRGKSLDIHLIENNDLQGYQALKNNQLKAKECIFGDFSNLLVGVFGGLEIKPLQIAGGSLKLEGFYDVDAAVKREKAFVISKAN